MERKIGEIFEYKGEWYQCVESLIWCPDCAFSKKACPHSTLGSCDAIRRKDKKNVIFKKLEKVGKPYPDYCPSERVIYFQRYKCYQKPISTESIVYWADNISVSIEIKQNKEDMEEKKLNLKPFDLAEAKAGRPVCTRDGRKARIICFDAKFPRTGNIVALVEKENGEETTLYYYDDGHCSIGKGYDLMMLPEMKEGWINIYRRASPYCKIYATENIAKNDVRGEDKDFYVGTIKIEWEE